MSFFMSFLTSMYAFQSFLLISASELERYVFVYDTFLVNQKVCYKPFVLTISCGLVSNKILLMCFICPTDAKS